ncbi:hypothetical protein YPPY64_4785, partial [Yersinia pestis PY-64]
MRIGRGV